MKRIVFDLDDTICISVGKKYQEAELRESVVERLREYKSKGFEIVIHTSRNVLTYNNNVGKIAANTLPVIIDWLNANDVPFDEIYIAKPWCGSEGFYVDDRAIRPSELVSKSYAEILALIEAEKNA